MDAPNALVVRHDPGFREQILWMCFGLALLAVFLVLLVQDAAPSLLAHP